MAKVAGQSGALMAQTFKIRVGVVVFDAENRLLLARQNKRPFWVLPGGTLEQGESMGDCAVREIKEEANLDIELGSLLFLSDFFAADGRQVMDVVFSGTLKGGTLQRETSENLDEIGFYTAAEVASYSLKPEPVFDRILSAWKSGVWPQGLYLGAYS
jgi:ADP-ribose pyrophosphatase YjhB (NUDIX family)